MSSNSKASEDPIFDSGVAEPASNGAHFSDEELRAAQRAALNLMEDALAARNRAEELNVELQRENAERARVQAALQASESQMRLVTDNLPVFIAYCDAEERFRFVNQPYADHFGLGVEEVIGKRIEEVVGSAAYGNFHQYVEVALAGRTVEFEQVSPHGLGKREMRCAYIPDLGPDGKTRGFFALIQDVTAQKLAEEQQARLAAIVTSSSDAIISFTAEGRTL
ncbi:MAG TPA: PAS domain-containing protein, partial [Candidatus Binatia bacterium]|nr:PAS domain-containing protein [Candidatus Binatia bacterium]